jgi:hypothetical protein
LLLKCLFYFCYINSNSIFLTVSSLRNANLCHTRTNHFIHRIRKNSLIFTASFPYWTHLTIQDSNLCTLLSREILLPYKKRSLAIDLAEKTLTTQQKYNIHRDINCIRDKSSKFQNNCKSVEDLLYFLLRPRNMTWYWHSASSVLNLINCIFTDNYCHRVIILNPTFHNI